MRWRIAAFLLLSMLAASGVQAFSVSGVVRYQGQGVIYINLVTAEDFEGEGGYGLMLLPSQSAGGEMPFRFNNVPAGVYGLRCFQDEDGDKRLNMGLFGPSEPWAMSWKGKRPFGRPSFKDVSFLVQGDVFGKVLVLGE